MTPEERTRFIDGFERRIQQRADGAVFVALVVSEAEAMLELLRATDRRLLELEATVAVGGSVINRQAAQIETLRGLLRDVEHVHEPDCALRYCPSCTKCEPEHSADCPLKAALEG